MKLTLRIWILLIVLIFSLVSIFVTPTFLQTGVVISNVEGNSEAFNQGLVQGDIIKSIDGNKISNLNDFTNAFDGKYLSNINEKTVFQTTSGEKIYYANVSPQISVSKISKTNVKTGLDLAGGSRALIQAKDAKLTQSEMSDLIDVIANRLNVYGIKDMRISPVRDLSGNNFISIEIAGATPSDLDELISKQGKFEAKIGDEIVFVGGDKDITSVSRSAPEALVESCNPSTDSGYFCNFRFTIYLSEDSAKRHADITNALSVNTSLNGNYLSKPLDLYLDDTLVDSLLISEGLKGRVTTQISISGSGSGLTREEAYENAKESMNSLQTVLITGSLPYKLEIVKLDTISPTLGKDFIRSIFIAGFSAILAVSIIVLIRYRNLKSSLALILTSVSEVIIILGISALFKVNYDLPAIAGMIAVIGTGIDSQIIVLDEARQNKLLSIKERIKRAFAIIMGSYFTAVVALLPLFLAGAGLLKGFAITTFIGLTIGVFVTRPAFADIISKIEK